MSAPRRGGGHIFSRRSGIAPGLSSGREGAVSSPAVGGSRIQNPGPPVGAQHNRFRSCSAIGNLHRPMRPSSYLRSRSASGCRRAIRRWGARGQRPRHTAATSATHIPKRPSNARSAPMGGTIRGATAGGQRRSRGTQLLIATIVLTRSASLNRQRRMIKMREDVARIAGPASAETLADNCVTARGCMMKGRPATLRCKGAG
jgi:hypothetical protein